MCLIGYLAWLFSSDTRQSDSEAEVCLLPCCPTVIVPTSSPSRGGDVVVYVVDINQPSLPTPFYSVLVSVSVFMALSLVFYSINSSDNSPISYSVLQVFILPYWSFQLYVSLLKSSSALIQSIVVNWAQNTN